MRKFVLAVALLGLFPACGSSDDKGKSTKAAAAKGPLRPAKELFAGPKVSLPKPLGDLKVRSSLAEARHAAPWLFSGKVHGAPVEGYDSVTIEVDLTEDNAYVRNVRVIVGKTTADEVRGFLSVAWGEPREGKTSLGDKKYFWVNPDDGLRATAEPTGRGGTQITYELSMSPDRFLGAEAGKFGFEKAPILGMDQAAVKTAFAPWLGTTTKPDQVSFSLPSFEASDRANWVFANFTRGKVSKVTVQLDFTGDDIARQAVLNGLDKKLGKAKQGDLYLEYAGPPKVKVDNVSKPAGLVLWIGG